MYSPFFQLEEASGCIHDSVTIRDGGDAEAELINTFCGKEKPEDIVSTGNKLYVKFFSDETVQQAGFAASFTNGKKV